MGLVWQKIEESFFRIAMRGCAAVRIECLSDEEEAHSTDHARTSNCCTASPENAMG